MGGPHCSACESPAAIEIEKLVLGSVIASNDPAYFAQVGDLITEADFALEKHRVIFRALTDLYQNGRSIDYHSLADHLGTTGQLDSVDGISYIVSLEDGMPHLVSIEDYCRRIKDKAILRETIQIAQNLIHRCTMQVDPPADLVLQAERIGQILGRSTEDDGVKTLQQIFDDAGGINQIFSTSRDRGLPLCMKALQETLAGMRPQQLIVIGGGTGEGKTAFAAQQAVATAELGHWTLVYSLEMSSLEVLQRQLANRAALSLTALHHDLLDQSDRIRLQEAATELLELSDHLLLSDRPNITVAAMSADLRRAAARRRQIRLIVVDYLQLMGAVGKFGTREQEIASISRGLKLLAKRFNVTVIVLSQLNRAAADRPNRRPELRHLRESGAIEQDADVVLFLWSDGTEHADATNSKVYWRVAKQRSGPCNEGTLRFNKKILRFEEPE
jgi:replicative DNA helicase